MLARIVASYEADPNLQPDLLQEVTLAIWRALPAFRGDASLKTFLARVAHNRAISHVTKAARTPKPQPVMPDLPSALPSPEDAANRTVMQMRLLEAVRTLPLIQREVITLALEGFSHQEIDPAEEPRR